MERINIQRKLFLWALERCGKTEEAMQRKFPKIADWLSGEVYPTLKQLESFAAATYTPVGYFFLNEPPEDKLPIPDFRTVKGQPQRPSPHLLDTIQTMQSRREWMREFMLEEGQPPLSFIKSATLRTNPAKVAMEMSNILSLSGGWAKRVRTWTEALRLLREAIEDAGVMIVINGVVGNNPYRPLDVAEFRGFALVDEYAPLIFINGRDSISAKMFTIIHELSHLWLGYEGVSNFDELKPVETNVEEFCNQVAAEFLVPSDEFKKALKENQRENDYDLFQILARRFKVSPLVTARRALDMKYISKNRFFGFYDNYAKDIKKRKPKGTGGNFWNTQIVRVGKLFGSAVVQATLEGRLLYRDAYRLTGLKGKTFDNYATLLGF
ncbi:MAG TPA: ImmA/IrrE family metallo-endopeptidase [Planctomycetes bacterium]|nr:ImmA/IrrE family metallo-endopeptidase [Planctomycetota bacterium]